MLDQFSATIEKIYAAAADASLWEDALRSIENTTGSTGAVLNLVPKGEAALPICLAGSFSRGDCADYAQNYMWRCPRIAFGVTHPEIPIHVDRMILSESEMDRDPTYEWYGKHGLRYYVAGWAGESRFHRAYMSLQRSRRQGHIEAGEVDTFGLILTHVAQAIGLAVKLGTLEQQTSFNLTLLDALPNAAFALDAAGNVLLANAKGEDMLATGDGLSIVNRRLHLRLASQQAALDQMIVQALCQDSQQARGGWVRVDRPSGMRAYVAFVSALSSEEMLFGNFPPKVLVIMVDPADAMPPNEQALHLLYGLTDTEARLASAIACGHSVESAAVSMRMQVATARSHLKAIFTKVGVNRQQDLVRLLTSLSSITI
jgi:DNA-binding CsgD family transcriptional regulator